MPCQSRIVGRVESPNTSARRPGAYSTVSTGTRMPGSAGVQSWPWTARSSTVAGLSTADGSAATVSPERDKIERMCDTLLPGAEALKSADDAAVVAAITWWTRAEAAASARRLEAVAELIRRRADGPTDCAHWSCDNWDAMAAEVGAAQGISHRMASSQMYLAVALRDRLPRVAALFAEGAIRARLVTTIVWHTDLTALAAMRPRSWSR